MVGAPAVTPETIPVPEPIVATEELLLLHVPPAVASLKVLVDPAHIVVMPLMAEGVVLTVKVLVAALPHPVE
jgi:hypothetical protein